MAICRHSQGSLFEEKHLHMVNWLEIEGTLMVRCWSNDNSLGTHYLTFKQDFEWQFYDQYLFGHTKFECDLEFYNGSDPSRGHFVVYDNRKRIRRRDCYKHCMWGVGVYGLYAFDENDQRWDYEIPWPSKNTFE
ncbi:conserved hypothetical protein [Ricinus communis]|uniref:S-protein homolog n=1 Tax=Ricinus communis TaxID=3988 RepID=B9T857_RICCO|nr:conserved hypothetical protein [Ricinus communis]|eukprot:XP_002534426.1 self-incompatibility protein S1 [Ricinus communis]